MKRLIIDLDDVAIENLDRLKDSLGFKTRSELVRNSLAILDLVSERQREGFKVQFKKDSKVIELLTQF